MEMLILLISLVRFYIYVYIYILYKIDLNGHEKSIFRRIKLKCDFMNQN